MAEVKLPEGWILTKFTEVLDVQGGTQPPKSEFIDHPSDGYVRLLQIRDFGNKPVPTYIPDTQKIKKCEINDVLIGRYGASLGRICTGMSGAYNVALAKVVVTSAIDGKFLRRYLESEVFQAPLGLLSRSAQNGFNKEDLSNFDFFVVPLAEQKIIAERLDSLLAQVATIKTRLDAIPALLNRFRQSVLSAAVSGKLTEEWRIKNIPSVSSIELLKKWLIDRESNFEKKGKYKEPLSPDIETNGPISIPESWSLVSVSQFAECLDYKRIPVKKENRQSASGRYPYFGANGEVDKVDDYIFDGDYVLVTEDETFYGREKPIAYRYTGKCWVNNHAHVLSAPTPYANDFLCYNLMYFNVIPWLSGTTGRAKLTQAALNVLPVGLPPEMEMNEIVRRVEQLFAYAESAEQQVAAAQSRVDKLTQAILAKAFSGELSADWRAAHPELISGEHSAAALLARIQAERAASAKPARNTRRNATA